MMHLPFLAKHASRFEISALCDFSQKILSSIGDRFNVPESMRFTSHFDLVIVDDCSTDATIEIADELAALYPQLRAVRHPAPQGRVAAIRTGLERGQGEVAFFTDEDCRLALDRVRRLWAELREYEVVVGRLWDPSADGTGIASEAFVGGGYQMGFRRVFCRVADALGNQDALTEKLLRYGIRWREVRLPGTASRQTLTPATATAATALSGIAEPDVRSVRTDRPETASGKTRQPNYLVRFRHATADD
jgi:cellulose synthase/poly-beta-1,6-N-acetylglucosamine synthase-like glycosyltransferase